MSAAEVAEHCRYGGTAVWVPRGDLGGSDARRLASRIGLHFRGEGTPLLLDLRNMDTLDSSAVEALARCCADHRGFHVVGRPLDWPALPLRLRLGIEALGAAADLVTALRGTTPQAPRRGGEMRRHPRIPVGIPVEVLLGGRTETATLAEIGRGGLRLEQMDGRFAAAAFSAPDPLEVLGLGRDPLARELLGPAAAGAVPAVPLYLLPGGGVGARFMEARPPV